MNTLKDLSSTASMYANEYAKLGREVESLKGMLATEKYAHRATIDQRDSALERIKHLETMLKEEGVEV